MQRKVSLLELFYDLIFAYIISQTAHVMHGIDASDNLLLHTIIFMLVFVTFINSWAIQTVYVNRYSKNSLTDIFFIFLNMIILLYLANSFNGKTYYNSFFLTTGLLSLTLAIQYFFNYCTTNKIEDKQISIIFVAILFVRALLMIIGFFISNTLGLCICILGILLSFVLPSITGRFTKKHPIIFSHLLERLMLLVIINFGETIVSISPYFDINHFSINQLGIFILVASLFFSYIIEFDHLINEKYTNDTGNRLIYLHYLILFGINFVTISLSHHISEVDGHSTSIIFLFFGILMFYMGVLLAGKYNILRWQFHRIYNFIILGNGLFFGLVCFFLDHNDLVYWLATLCVIINTCILIYFYVTNKSKSL